MVYDTIIRLRKVLDVLSVGTWIRQDELMQAVGYAADETAKAMLRRDITALVYLGFTIERKGGHPVQYKRHA